MNKKVQKKSEAVCKRLVLDGHWFNEIKSGRKKVEFRDGTKRYDAMFLKNPPDEIEFSLGYTNDPKKLMRFKVQGIHRLNLTMDELFDPKRTKPIEEIDIGRVSPKTLYAIHLGERLA